jgi:hypothetical protein
VAGGALWARGRVKEGATAAIEEDGEREASIEAAESSAPARAKVPVLPRRGERAMQLRGGGGDPSAGRGAATPVGAPDAPVTPPGTAVAQAPRPTASSGAWVEPPPRLTSAQMAAALRNAGMVPDDAGRFVIRRRFDPMDVPYGFDPNERSPELSFKSCMEFVETCMLLNHGDVSRAIDTCGSHAHVPAAKHLRGDIYEVRADASSRSFRSKPTRPLITCPSDDRAPSGLNPRVGYFSDPRALAGSALRHTALRYS